MNTNRTTGNRAATYAASIAATPTADEARRAGWRIEDEGISADEAYRRRIEGR